MWANWIASYGYLALFLGTMLEGEAVLIIAGYSLARGYLDPVPTYLVAVCGAATADATYFWLGRSFGARMVRAFPRLRPLRARATLFVRRNGHTAAFLSRFAYGLRLVLPMMIGALRMRPAIFHIFAALGAICFAAVYLCVGYLFGQAIATLIGRVSAWETAIVVGVLLLGVLAVAYRDWRIYHSDRSR
jgi:membrane protein DedA with SNARE-associated domain